MKTPLLMALALSAAPFPMLASVAPGATWEEVQGALGRPNGEVRIGERHVLYYDRGSVEFAGGRVVRVDLRTAGQQADLEAREARRRAELEARRAELIAEGTELRDAKLADAAFRATPAAYQVAFWEDFARRYPGVPCVEPLSLARVKHEEERAEKLRKAQESRRLAELEARLAEAERRPLYVVRRSFGRHQYRQDLALWPVKYTYYDSPLPVYTTPGTPAVDGLRGLGEVTDQSRSGRLDDGRGDARDDRGSRRGTDRRFPSGRL